jgi:thiol-disulfide isomerase/thioredoxin
MKSLSLIPMKQFFISILLFSGTVAYSQKAEIIKLERLQKIIHEKSDKIQVLNFWATWCGPCVKELPLFEKLNASAQTDVKITLVSLDLDLDPDPAKVYKFIERKNLQSEVLILDEKDSNAWIDKIDKNWSGALPATIIINQRTGQRKFVGKELHEGDLERLIEEIK